MSPLLLSAGSGMWTCPGGRNDCGIYIQRKSELEGGTVHPGFGTERERAFV